MEVELDELAIAEPSSLPGPPLVSGWVLLKEESGIAKGSHLKLANASPGVPTRVRWYCPPHYAEGRVELLVQRTVNTTSVLSKWAVFSRCKETGFPLRLYQDSSMENVAGELVVCAMSTVSEVSGSELVGRRFLKVVADGTGTSVQASLVIDVPDSNAYGNWKTALQGAIAEAKTHQGTGNKLNDLGAREHTVSSSSHQETPTAKSVAGNKGLESLSREGATVNAISAAASAATASSRAVGEMGSSILSSFFSKPEAILDSRPKWSFGQLPIWRQGLFQELFADMALKGGEDVAGRTIAKSGGELFRSRLRTAMELLTLGLHRLSNTSAVEDRAANSVQVALKAGLEVLKRIPFGSGEHDKYLQFISWFVNKVQLMQPGHIIIIPGGWMTAPCKVEKDGATNSANTSGILDGGSHAMLHVLSREADGTFSLATVNSGNLTNGLAYHPTCVEPDYLGSVKSLVLNQDGIEPIKLQDSSFWILLFRPLVFASDFHRIEDLYATLLPYLNGRPLTDLAAVTQYAHWERPLITGDASLGQCVLAAVRFALTRARLSLQAANRMCMRFRCALVQMAVADLKQVECIPARDATILTMAATNMCNAAAKQSQDESAGQDQKNSLQIAELDAIRNLSTEVQTIVARHTLPTGMGYLPFHVSLGAPLIEAASWPFFGRLLPLANVDALMGDSQAPPIIRAVNLALIPNGGVVKSLEDAACVLRHAEHLCTLLANQASLMRNSIPLRLVLIQHVFLSVIPLPLPLSHKDRQARCFWAAPEVRYETQHNILGLLRLLSFHYAAAALSLPADRHIDALRVLTAASISAMADAAVRIVAIDIASPFSLHYAGRAPGPSLAFGFTMRKFVSEVEHLPITFPEHMTALTQVLDYFSALDEGIASDHVVFAFSSGMQCSPGDAGLINQVCLHMGYPSDVQPAMYLTGQNSDLLDEFPELCELRDIVFLAKLLLVPVLEGLPETKSWRPSQAKLSWKWDPKEMVYAVSGFGGKRLDPSIGAQFESGGRKSFWASLFTSGQKPRCPPSGANASVLTGQIVESEDDVLHIRKMPDFDGNLRPAETELLLSFLTAPYVRIPLVLQFFATPERINALSNEELRGIVEAVVFEPGSWLPPSAEGRTSPQHAPDIKRTALATPCGLLFNELACSPASITASMEHLLSLALDLDMGKWSDTASRVLLFTVRMAAHIEAYMLFLIQHAEWRAKGTNIKASSGGFASIIRGLQTIPGATDVLKQAQMRLRLLLEGRATVVLQRSLSQTLLQSGDSRSCAIHAHLALIWRSANMFDGGLHRTAVSTLLQAQAFLTAHYYFDVGNTQQKAAGWKDLGVPEGEIFSLFQKFRADILSWCESHPIERSEVMEEVVRAVVLNADNYNGDGVIRKRRWVQMPHVHGGAGRFIPDSEAERLLQQHALSTKGEETYEAWMRRTCAEASSIEVNINTGEVTVQQHHFQAMPKTMAQAADVISAVGILDKETCAEVSSTDQRLSITLVAHQIELQSWAPDPRPTSVPNTHRRKYDPRSMNGEERWIVPIVEPQRGRIMPKVQLFLSSASHAKQAYALLMGLHDGPFLQDLKNQVAEKRNVQPGSKLSTERAAAHTLVEVLVTRTPPSMQVYRVTSFCRRRMRVLVYSSGSAGCLASVPKSGGAPLAMYAQEDDPNDVSYAVIRQSALDHNMQTYIPSRFISGLLPQVLVDRYSFWQHDKNSIVGYPLIAKQDPTRSMSIIQIQLFSNPKACGENSISSDAQALVKRLEFSSVALDSGSRKTPAGFHLEAHLSNEDNHPLTLVNILCESFIASHKELLQIVKISVAYVARLRLQVISRLDVPAHTLVWSKMTPESLGDATSVNAIEMPRLRLSFTMKEHIHGISASGGGTKSVLWCEQHPGLFLSSQGDEEGVSSILRGLPHAVLLEDNLGSLFVLVSAIAKPELIHSGSEEDALLTCGADVDYTDQVWEENLGASRTYLYPLHVSGGFIQTTSIASTLQMFIFRFLAGQYVEAFRLASACFSDQMLTPEEAQLFQRLEILAHDEHPDAHATRLHFVVVSGRISVPGWELKNDLWAYVLKYSGVSATCRISLEEEMELMERLHFSNPDSSNIVTSKQSSTSHELQNRIAVVRLLASHVRQKKSLREIQAEVPVRHASQTELPIFDEVDDRTCLDAKAVKQKDDSFFTKLMAGSYNRPEPERLTGLDGLRRVLSWFEKGIHLRPTKDSPSFPLLYDLLTGGVSIRVLPGDVSHNWGALLLHLFPPEVYCRRGLHLSLLRVLSYNRAACADAPVLEVEEKTGIQKLFSVDSALAALPRRAAAFVQCRGTIVWPPTQTARYAPPKAIRIVDARAWVSPRAANMSCENRVIHSRDGIGNSSMSKTIIEAFATTPLSNIGLQFTTEATRLAQALTLGNAQQHTTASTALPFDISGHNVARSRLSKATMQRLQDDYANEMKSSAGRSIQILKGFKDSEIVCAYQTALNALALVDAQVMRDKEMLRTTRDHLMQTAANGPSVFAKGRSLAHSTLELARDGGSEPVVSLDVLTAFLMSTTGVEELMVMNPLLTREDAMEVLEETAIVLLIASRFGQGARCRSTLQRLVVTSKEASQSGSQRVWEQAKLLATEVAHVTLLERHFMQSVENASYAFDPRFLVFEYTHNIILRKEQVDLIRSFVGSAKSSASVCHQMLMGGGKTTVVAPLVAMILAERGSLVTSVVPASLLTFAQSVLRSTLISSLHRRVIILQFSRYMKVTDQLATKLEQARKMGSIVLAQPGSLKSLFLKLLECFHLIDATARGCQEGLQKKRGAGIFSMLKNTDKKTTVDDLLSSDAEEELRMEIKSLVRILNIFKSGVLMMDEVDLLLHPLRSELHWPLGLKLPLDFTQAKMGIGLRWQLPQWLLCAVTAAWDGDLTKDLHDSHAATAIITELNTVFATGLKERRIQAAPHPVLLDHSFYHTKLRPPLTQWALLWLHDHGAVTVATNILVEYLSAGPRNASSATLKAVTAALSDDCVKALNLLHDWLSILLPHCLSKVNRVTYGLLTDTEVQSFVKENPNMTKSRRLLAIPFVGKDCPSPTNEFSHPDVSIGLTVLAYRYGGMRKSDVVKLVRHIQSEMRLQSGPYSKRPMCQLYRSWVEAAGFFVRGETIAMNSSQQGATNRATNPLSAKKIVWDHTSSEVSELIAEEGIWPLELLNLADTEHLEAVHTLLSHLPHAIEYYLDHLVFPLTMQNQPLMLSSSGHDLGSDMLFGVRLGFSGTPTDLLPFEMGKCIYERGSDGKMLHLLTSPEVASIRTIPPQWTPRTLLQAVANANPPYHALIDVGALITGISNLEAAKILLAEGLAARGFEGVVFVTDDGDELILKAAGNLVVPLPESGISDPEKRFTFYDQVHTTGIDVKQAPGARAAMTLGKDMTWRDFTQGAWRMRGLEAGQRVEVLVTPEMARIICEATPSAPSQPSKQPSILLLPGTPEASFSQQAVGEGVSAGHKGLCQVAAWLILSGLSAEATQYSLLCEHRARHVWRQHAHVTLLRNHELVGKASGTTAEGKHRELGQCMDSFRERISYFVENAVPVVRQLTDRLTAAMAEHQAMLISDDQHATLTSILRDAADLEGDHAVDDMGETPDNDGATKMEMQQEQEQEQEEEQEKEREREQEQEEEMEVVVEEELTKLKWTREDEACRPWALKELNNAPSESVHGFYPLADFSLAPGIFAGVFNSERKCGPVPFPPYILLSRNHYAKHWGLRGGARRLKNVVVLMDWVPNTSTLSFARSQNDLLPEQETRLKEVFALFDNDGDGMLTEAEFKELLSTMGAGSFDVPSAPVDFAALKQLFTDHRFQPQQEGRFQVALTMAEAEAVRAALHTTNLNGRPLVAEGSTLLGLRILLPGSVPRSYVLDSTPTFVAAPEFQQNTSEQALRFFDSQFAYEESEQDLLLQALHRAPCSERITFFDGVLACRRRSRLPWERTDLRRVLSLCDHYELHSIRALIYCIRRTMHMRGLLAADTFRAFDSQARGYLERQDLAHGLKRLGLQLTQTQVTQVVDYITEGLTDGNITLARFREIFGGQASQLHNMDGAAALAESQLLAGSNVSTPSMSHPVTVLPLSAAGGEVTADIPEAILRSFKVKLQPVNTLECIWSSRGTKSRDQASVWQPVLEMGLLQRNKARVCIGHYPNKSFKAPVAAAKPLLRGHTLEVVDTKAYGVYGSQWIDAVLARGLPPPTRFRQVWSLVVGTDEGQQLFIWEGVPPSEHFLCLGMVATTSDKPPPLDSVRCVPRRWTTPTREIPQLIWENAGTGGRHGSLWLVGQQGLLNATPGAQPPTEGLYELAADALTFGPKLLLESRDTLSSFKSQPTPARVPNNPSSRDPSKYPGQQTPSASSTNPHIVVATPSVINPTTIKKMTPTAVGDAPNLNLLAANTNEQPGLRPPPPRNISGSSHTSTQRPPDPQHPRPFVDSKSTTTLSSTKPTTTTYFLEDDWATFVADSSSSNSGPSGLESGNLIDLDSPSASNTPAQQQGFGDLDPFAMLDR